MKPCYTDIVMDGDRLEVEEGDKIVTYLVVDTLKDIAVRLSDRTTKRKINRRGNVNKVFIGNYPVVGRS